MDTGAAVSFMAESTQEKYLFGMSAQGGRSYEGASQV